MDTPCIPEVYIKDLNLSLLCITMVSTFKREIYDIIKSREDGIHAHAIAKEILHWKQKNPEQRKEELYRLHSIDNRVRNWIGKMLEQELIYVYKIEQSPYNPKLKQILYKTREGKTYEEELTVRLRR